MDEIAKLPEHICTRCGSTELLHVMEMVVALLPSNRGFMVTTHLCKVCCDQMYQSVQGLGTKYLAIWRLTEYKDVVVTSISAMDHVSQNETTCKGGSGG